MSAVAIGPGARSLERELLRRVRADQQRIREAPAQAARPLRLVVPSRALRSHLASTLLRETGPALLGVRIQTLVSLAREILEGQGAAPEREDLFPILVRREARREPALRAPLDDLADGYAAVRAGADDLLDAGFAAAHADAVDDALAALGLAVSAPERALVRVAGRVAAALGPQLSHRSRLFGAAREALERDPAEALPSRAVAIYGFSDATGVQADLLAALVHGCGAEVYLELPPDPTCSERAESPLRFGAPLRERLCGAAGSQRRLAAEAPAQIAIWRARNPSEEARAVAGALRERLASGVAPERLAVVARDLAPYALALRRELTALAVPFSGVGEAGPVAAAGRQLAALLALLQGGESVPAERWLEAVWRLPQPGGRSGAHGAPPGLERRADLQHALHARGCAALRDAASLAPARTRLSAPLGLAAGDSEGLRRVAREVGAEWMDALAAAAGALCARLAAWPESAAPAEHAGRLDALVRESLGWEAETPGRDALDSLLADAGALGAWPLERDEFFDWLARAFAGQGRAPLGGAGAGVQLSSVMQARGLVFEHLYVLGLNRGAFPRPIREDPLLPDRARRALRALLPELPIKREGFDEERFLFAQLLAAGPSLTLSYSEWDEQGRPLAPSPLLDALSRGPLAAQPERAPLPALATPRERACQAGLRASREDFAAALEIALEDSQAGAAAGVPAARLASARGAVLAELDPRGAGRGRAGPYLGFVGRRGARDPRAGPLHVTRLEGLARCPWQAFLERLLGLKPTHDARGALPEGRDARVLGNVVHRALEAVAARSAPSGAALDALRGAEARPLAWPDDAELDAILLGAAQGVVREEAIALESYAVALAHRARPCVLEARRADWSSAAPRVLGAEVEGALALIDAEGAPREIRFKADRVDAGDTGLRLTDYKSGRPPSKESPDPARQAAALRARIAQGSLLQAAVYAAAAGAGARGRYLYLAPDLPDAAREVVAPAGAEARAQLDGVLRTLLTGWDAGAFFPRLREPAKDQEPFACFSCRVKDACWRGDSGVRARLGEWAESEPSSPAERAALALWRLAEDTP
jgi:hypothetical protein